MASSHIDPGRRLRETARPLSLAGLLRDVVLCVCHGLILLLVRLGRDLLREGARLLLPQVEGVLDAGHQDLRVERADAGAHDEREETREHPLAAASGVPG